MYVCLPVCVCMYNLAYICMQIIKSAVNIFDLFIVLYTELDLQCTDSEVQL